jgi:hypothetical protein
MNRLKKLDDKDLAFSTAKPTAEEDRRFSEYLQQRKQKAQKPKPRRRPLAKA